jgi:hypothetical protein
MPQKRISSNPVIFTEFQILGILHNIFVFIDCENNQFLKKYTLLLRYVTWHCIAKYKGETSKAKIDYTKNGENTEQISPRFWEQN